MDTATFLKTILPTRGVIFVAKIKRRPGHPKGDQTIQYPVADADEAADKALELNSKYPADNVYYAMASYKEVIYKKAGDFEYASGRTQSNALNVKSLWLDWDVGKEGAYATREEALAGIKQYVTETGLPTPVIVSSGYGIHTYWPFTEEVTAAEWESIAAYQRLIWRHLGLKVDAACDKDCARVLRPTGTHNRRTGQEDRLVKVVSKTVPALPAMEYKRLLKGCCDRLGLSALVKNDIPEFMRGDTSNIEDMRPEFAKSYAKNIVKFCKQIAEFSENGGESEPLWYANLGVLKHAEDGQHYAHVWGSNHPGYDEGQTQTKFDQWNTGPTTCDKFRELNPSACAGCSHKCKSPIQLGLEEETKAPEPVAIVPEEPEHVEEAPFNLGAFWPKNYVYDKDADTVFVNAKNPDTGLVERQKMATPLFYPVAMLRLEDGTFGFRMHMEVRGKIREFQLPLKALSEAKALKVQLVSNQIHVYNKEAALAYINSIMVSMRRAQQEIHTYKQMGWHHDGKAFLIGDTLITATETRKVLLGESFPSEVASCFGINGSKEDWISAVNTLYNQKHGEPYQFAVCAAFAAPLNDMLGFSEWCGIPYALTSTLSGYGKSTVNKIALSIWMKQSRSVVVSESTPKAILGMASAFGNLPFLLDEATSYLKDPKDLSDTLYALSNGAPRLGMTNGGHLRQALPSWNTSVAITGNRNMMHQVTENKLNPEATQMRIFEIDLEGYPRIEAMDKNSKEYELHNAEHAHLARTIVEDSYGHIGVEWIRFLMANREEVRARLRKVSIGMSKFMEGGDASKERFYYHLITCVLVAGYYAKKLGYHQFDLNNLRDWCVRHVQRLRGVAQEYQNTSDDHFANMMSDLSGNIIITKNFEALDGRAKASEFHIGGTLKSPIAGRYVLGDEKERPKLFVTVKAVRQWCAEHGVQFNTLRRDFIKENILRLGASGINKETGASRQSLSKGVQGVPHLGNPWVLELDAERAAKTMADNIKQMPPKEAAA